ncbi:AP complex subunit beta [Mycena indigotica]|uniref:ER membrane protein complex subunit 4 n=1 Tax=Mycena indigotica TaxID=2126181 RepID=A0A8H6SR80_9AGAR|nr:AP complex subunit beta [Mycena indigotica]KAF7303728.1 AP complex subunit beta [Mycena indigotica]
MSPQLPTACQEDRRGEAREEEADGRHRRQIGWLSTPPARLFQVHVGPKAPGKPLLSGLLSRTTPSKRSGPSTSPWGRAKQLPMQAFMLYMSGSGVQIFSMGIVFMLLLSPFKNIAGMNQAFAQFAPTTAANPKSLTTLIGQKTLFILCINACGRTLEMSVYGVATDWDRRLASIRNEGNSTRDRVILTYVLWYSTAYRFYYGLHRIPISSSRFMKWSFRSGQTSITTFSLTSSDTLPSPHPTWRALTRWASDEPRTVTSKDILITVVELVFFVGHERCEIDFVTHCLLTDLLVVYLFLVSYGRSKPEQIHLVIPNFLQDCNDRNPLIRALAIRTMSYIPIPVVTDALNDNLRYCLKDNDPYVRKMAAICVAKLYAADPRRAEKSGFVEMLRDLMLDNNATVVANAVAALSEIGDRQDGVIFKLNLTTSNKLLAALDTSPSTPFSLACYNDRVGTPSPRLFSVPSVAKIALFSAGGRYRRSLRTSFPLRRGASGGGSRAILSSGQASASKKWVLAWVAGIFPGLRRQLQLNRTFLTTVLQFRSPAALTGI